MQEIRRDKKCETCDHSRCGGTAPLWWCEKTGENIRREDIACSDYEETNYKV